MLKGVGVGVRGREGVREREGEGEGEGRALYEEVREGTLITEEVDKERVDEAAEEEREEEEQEEEREIEVVDEEDLADLGPDGGGGGALCMYSSTYFDSLIWTSPFLREST